MRYEVFSVYRILFFVYSLSLFDLLLVGESDDITECGTLELWNSETLKVWNIEILEHWNTSFLALSSDVYDCPLHCILDVLPDQFLQPGQRLIRPPLWMNCDHNLTRQGVGSGWINYVKRWVETGDQRTACGMRFAVPFISSSLHHLVPYRYRFPVPPSSCIR